MIVLADRTGHMKMSTAGQMRQEYPSCHSHNHHSHHHHPHHNIQHQALECWKLPHYDQQVDNLRYQKVQEEEQKDTDNLCRVVAWLCQVAGSPSQEVGTPWGDQWGDYQEPLKEQIR